MKTNDAKSLTLEEMDERMENIKVVPPVVKKLKLDDGIINKHMAVLRHIYPNATRKTLRRLLKNKAFMKKLDIRPASKDKS